MITQLRIKSAFCSFVFLLVLIETIHCFSAIDKANLHGIWRLECDCLPYEEDIRSKLFGLISNGEVPLDEILIKINPDGTFKQCNEGYKEGRSITGKWEMGKNDAEVFLACRRQYYGPAVDVLMRVNKLHVCGSKLQMSGEIEKGKYALPQKHPDFFHQLIPNGCTLGSFRMEQILSTTSLLTTSNDGGGDLEMYF